MVINKILYMLPVIMVLFGCRSDKDVRKERVSQIPTYYPVNAADSLSYTPANWRTLLFDSTLVRIIDTALVHNYDLKEAFQNVEIARSGLRFTKGIRLPEWNMNAAAGIRRFGHYTMDGIGNYDTRFSPNLSSKELIPDPLPDYYIGLQSSWEIDLWGRLKNKKRSALLRFLASQSGKNFVLTNLVAEVSEAYFDLLAVTNELNILEDNIELQQNAVEVITAQMKTGKANQLAVDMMKAQLLNSKSAYAEALQRKTECMNKLRFLCGGVEMNLPSDSLFKANHVADSLKVGIPSDLLQNRPDIKQAELELAASNADLASAKAAFYPSLNINAAIGYQAFNAALLVETPTSVAYNVLGGLSAPLLNRRRIKADLMMAEAEKKRAYINYEKVVFNGFIEVYNALSNINTTREALRLKQQEADIFKASINTSAELFKAGRAGYLEVILSQRNALQSQLELISVKKRQQQAIIYLYRSIGGGWQ